MSIAIYNSEATDGWVISAPELQTPEEGWDTLKRHVMVYTTDGQQAAKDMFTKGDADDEFTSMFLTDINPKPAVCGLGFYEVELLYKGLAGDKPIKWSVVTLSERNSYKDIEFTGYLATPGAGDVAEPRIGVRALYVSLSDPDMSVVGTAMDPDYAPTPPDSLWDSIPDGQQIKNIPKFWVLDARNGPQLPGTTAYLMEDVYSFYQAVKPSK